MQCRDHKKKKEKEKMDVDKKLSLRGLEMEIYTAAAWCMDGSSSVVYPGFHKIRVRRSKRKEEAVECDK